MTVSSLQEAARQEAERRWPEPLRAMIGEDVAKSARNAFMAGAAWAEQEAAVMERAQYEPGEEVTDVFVPPHSERGVRFSLDFKGDDVDAIFAWHDPEREPNIVRALKALVLDAVRLPEPGSTGQED